MMRLFAMPGTCALAPNIVSIWGNVDLEVVNLERGQHREPDYLAINRKGQVPALVLDGGHVITEASAIMRYLAALSIEGGLNPSDPVAWAAIDEALSYFTSEIHADFGGHFATQRFAQSEAAQNEVRSATYDKLREHLDRLEGSLGNAGGNWYLGHYRSCAANQFYVSTDMGNGWSGYEWLYSIIYQLLRPSNKRPTMILVGTVDLRKMFGDQNCNHCCDLK